MHDRLWRETTIFAKTRPISYGGAKRKFDVHACVRSHLCGRNHDRGNEEEGRTA